MGVGVEGAAFTLPSYSFPSLRVFCLPTPFRWAMGFIAGKVGERRTLGFPYPDKFRVVAIFNLIGHFLAKCPRPSHSYYFSSALVWAFLVLAEVTALLVLCEFLYC